MGNKSKGIWEILNNDLRDYSNVELLNDFNFILLQFGQKRNKFLELYKYILGKDQEGPSVPAQESLVLIRNMRNRVFYATYVKQRELLYNDSDNVKEINAQNLLDRIHSYIMYSFSTMILNSVEWGRIKDYDETDKLITAKAMLNGKKVWMEKAKKIYR